MATTRILDHYRASVINDKQLFHVLAIIYKSGSENEKDLGAKTNLLSRELGLVLNKLYRANLIRVISTDTWAVTSLAEEMLSLLSISEAASKSFISEQDLPQPDKSFLQACLVGSSFGNYSWSRDVSSVLRATKIAFKIASESEPIDSKERARTLYAFVIGMNPNAKSVDTETYCKKMVQLYSSDHFGVAPSLLFRERKPKDIILQHCLDGVSDFKSSNHLLLTGESRVGKTDFLITLTRFIANIMVQRDTCDLHLVYSMDQDVFSRGWDSLARWQPSIESNVARYCEAFDKDFSTSNKIGELREKLVCKLKGVTKSKDKYIEAHPKLLFWPFSNTADDCAEALTAVSILRKAIIGGDLDELSEVEKRQIIVELTSIAEIARQRFSSRIDS